MRKVFFIETGVTEVKTKSKYQFINHALSKVIRVSNYEFYFIGSDNLDEIQRGDIVVPLGSIPTSLFTDEMLFIAAKQELNYKGASVYPCFSPSYIGKWPNYKFIIINRINTILNGGAVVDTLTQWELIDSIDRLDEVLGYIEDVGCVAIDYETTGLEYWKDDFYITILGMCFQSGYGYILPIGHFESPFTETEMDQCIKVVGERLFENQAVRKIAHNMKFEKSCTKTLGYDLKGRLDDTLLMHYLLDENSRHGLKELTHRYFPEFGDYNEGVKGDDWEFIDLHELGFYCAVDCDMTFRLSMYFESELLKDERLYFNYRNYTIPLMKYLLTDAENEGALIDEDYINKSIVVAEKYLDEIESEMLEIKEVKRFIITERENTNRDKLFEFYEKRNKYIEKYGEDSHYVKRYDEKILALKTGEVDYYDGFNFASTKQIASLLYDPHGFKFPLPYDYKKKGKTRGTGKDLIKDFDHIFINELLAHRTISKMVSTYYKGILDKSYKGRVHTSFNLGLTVTGRLSSSKPNLQNIPVRLSYENERAEECLKRVKKFFINLSEDHILMQADFSQAELRVAANFSGDKAMKESYLNGIDLHKKTGAEVVASSDLNRRVTVDEFDTFSKEDFKKYRFHAKSVNFGAIYGQSVHGLKNYMKDKFAIIMTEDEVSKVREKFFKTYTELLKWHRTYEAKAKKYGYVRTLFGRMRRLPDVYSTNDRRSSDALRQAINAPIQGTAVELALFTALMLKFRLPKSAVFFNTVHDSFVYWMQKDRYKSNIKIMDYTVENLPTEFYLDVSGGDVPMKLDYEISSTNWGELEEI